jgi:hypothetical protein
MSEMVLTPTAAQGQVAGAGARLEGTAPVPTVEQSAPVLITTQEVMFATAAVVPGRTSSRTGWWTAIVRYLTAAADASAPDDERRAPKHYPPKKYTYLETSSMRRAMERL